MVWIEGTPYSAMLDHARSESIVDGDDQDGDITIAAAPTTQTGKMEHDGEEYSSFFV